MLQPKILEVHALDEYKLLLKFASNEVKIFDVSPYISGTWFGKLKDLAYFKTVHISGSSIVWADGQDIAPHELYENSVAFVQK